MADVLPNHRADSRYLSFVLTTGLAVFFNILIILVICYGVIPRIDHAAQQAERSAAEAEKSKAIIESNTRQLNEHATTIRRLNTLLDIAEARLKEAEAKKKDKRE